MQRQILPLNSRLTIDIYVSSIFNSNNSFSTTITTTISAFLTRLDSRRLTIKYAHWVLEIDSRLLHSALRLTQLILIIILYKLIIIVSHRMAPAVIILCLIIIFPILIFHIQMPV